MKKATELTGMTMKMKWLVGAFVLSVVLNVFAAGIGIGQLFWGHPPSQHQPQLHPFQPPHLANRAQRSRGLAGDNVTFHMKRMSKHLKVDDRRKMREALHQQRSALKARYTSLRQSQKQIKKLLVTETVDKAALSEALSQHTALLQDMRMPMNIVLLEVIADLDQETRRKIAEDVFKHGSGLFQRPKKYTKRTAHSGLKQLNNRRPEVERQSKE